MRTFLPIKAMIDEVTTVFGIPREKMGHIRVWEDNAGCLALAQLKSPQVTPSAKFYAIKLHWFREQLEPNDIEILKIDTEVQLADLWTKPFTKERFEQLRKLVCGW